MTNETARRAVWPTLQVAGAALLFSTGGAAIKATTLGAGATAALRSAVAAVVLAALFPEARRRWTRATWLAALAYAATLVLFVHATKRTTAANAIFLQSGAPLYLLLLGPWLLKEKLRRLDLWMGLLVGTGLVVFMLGRETAQASAPEPALGNLLAVISGVAWALALAGLRRAARSGGGSALGVVVAGNAMVALLSGAAALPMAMPGWRDLAVVAYLGCVQIGLAYVLLTRGMRRVPAFEASLILLLEPVMNPIWAWMLHGERMGAWPLAGAALILSGIAFQAWSTRSTAASSS